ncbi:MAG: FxLYD domain-containing protein [Nitrosopumilaceae archaeon]
MKKAIILAVLLILSIFAPISGWAQYTQPSSSLTVKVITTYSYKAEDGSTVVIGEVQNTNNFPVTGVKLGVSFYDEKGKILEYKTGTTLLKVIPAGGKAPYSIISSKKEPAITDVSINLTGFNSSPARPQVLQISPGTLQISDQLTFSGTMINGGTIPTTGTTIYLLSYDAFDRVVGIVTATPLPNNIGPGKIANFSMTSIPNSITRSYKLLAESDNFQSSLVDVKDIKVKLSSLTKLVTIADISVTDPQGNKYNTIPVGSQVNITSSIWIKYAADQSTEQPYICYVQIKRVGGGVEFIGTAEGVFHGAEKQNPSVMWVPDSDGAFFIEVYVWDLNAVALSSPSSIINLMLVQ